MSQVRRSSVNEEEWLGSGWITGICRDIGSCPSEGDENTEIWKQQQQPTPLLAL